ncbi:hypothetical protein QTP86_017814, partial [Hemibagrus guttatus]
MPINLPRMSLDRGRKPEHPEETPEARGEHANSTHTRRRRESNPRPWRCEANVLTTKPPCPPEMIHWLQNVTGSLCLSQASLGIKAGYALDRVQGTHTLSFTHAIAHYGQFRYANQPTMHVFGLVEETGVPGGNPQGTGRTCKLHTHTLGGGENRTPNPG